jgi:hypothetical protein
MTVAADVRISGLRAEHNYYLVIRSHDSVVQSRDNKSLSPWWPETFSLCVELDAVEECLSDILIVLALYQNGPASSFNSFTGNELEAQYLSAIILQICNHSYL